MPLNLPDSALVIFNRMGSDFLSINPDINFSSVVNQQGFDENVIRIFGVGISNDSFATYGLLDSSIRQVFYDTTTGDFLVEWAKIWGFFRLGATKAIGFVTFTGIDATVIPILTAMTSTSGGFYETQAVSTISDTTLTVVSLTQIAGLASAETDVDHGFATNMTVTPAGASETEYNGATTITVTGPKTYDYVIVGNPTSPATGTLTVDAIYTTVEIQSDEFGFDQNLAAGSPISITPGIVGVDGTGFVAFDEVGGGTDTETDTSLRDRWLFRIQNPVALFNESSIKIKAREVAGVTRVFVISGDTENGSIGVTLVKTEELVIGSVTYQFATFVSPSPHGFFTGKLIRPTGANEPEFNFTIPIEAIVLSSFHFMVPIGGTPPSLATGNITVKFALADPGTVEVYVMRDNDPDPFPTLSEVQAVKDKLLEIKPIELAENRLIVAAPDPKPTDFVFASIVPDTQAMRDAITVTLESFFIQFPSVGESVAQIKYESQIDGTKDASSNPLDSFELTEPIGDIQINPSELATLGTITYP